MPQPIRTGTFPRRLSAQEFTRHYQAELQVVREMKASGADTTRLEEAINVARVKHAEGGGISAIDVNALIERPAGVPVTIPVPHPVLGNILDIRIRR
jgi:hypothetical protein